MILQIKSVYKREKQGEILDMTVDCSFLLPLTEFPLFSKLIINRYYLYSSTKHKLQTWHTVLHF